MVAGHEPHGAAAEDAGPVELAAVEEGEEEPRVVGDGRGQAGAARVVGPGAVVGVAGRVDGAAVRTCDGVFRHLDEAVGPRRVDRRVAIGVRGIAEEAGVEHPQRLEDGGPHVVGERPAADDLDDPPQHVHPQAVGEPLARLVQERQRRQPVDHLPHRAGGLREPVGDAGLDVARREPRRGEEAVAEARRVGQEMPDGDGPVEGGGLRPGHAAGPEHPDIRERGDVHRDGVVEQERARLVELHRRDARDRLGHRGDAEQGVGLHRGAALKVAPAHRLEMPDAAEAGDQGDGAGDLPPVHRLLHQGHDPAEAVRIQAEPVGRRGRQVLPDRGAPRRHQQQAETRPSRRARHPFGHARPPYS